MALTKYKLGALIKQRREKYDGLEALQSLNTMRETVPAFGTLRETFPFTTYTI